MQCLDSGGIAIFRMMFGWKLGGYCHAFFANLFDDWVR